MSKFVQILTVSLILLLSGCGDGSLTRSAAKKAIEEKLNAKDYPEVTLQVGDHSFNRPGEEYRLDTICFSLMAEGRSTAGNVPYRQPQGNWKNWFAASEAGYITATAHEYAGYFLGSNYTAIKCKIQLTEKAQKYITKKGNDGMVTLKTVDGIDVEVTGVTKPADMFGHTVSEAEYSYTFRLNELGKALATNDADSIKARQGRFSFRLFDDGWRL